MTTRKQIAVPAETRPEYRLETLTRQVEMMEKNANADLFDPPTQWKAGMEMYQLTQRFFANHLHLTRDEVETKHRLLQKAAACFDRITTINTAPPETIAKAYDVLGHIHLELFLSCRKSDRAEYLSSAARHLNRSGRFTEVLPLLTYMYRFLTDIKQPYGKIGEEPVLKASLLFLEIGHVGNFPLLGTSVSLIIAQTLDFLEKLHTVSGTREYGVFCLDMATRFSNDLQKKKIFLNRAQQAFDECITLHKDSPGNAPGKIPEYGLLSLVSLTKAKHVRETEKVEVPFYFQTTILAAGYTYGTLDIKKGFLLYQAADSSIANIILGADESGWSLALTALTSLLKTVRISEATLKTWLERLLNLGSFPEEVKSIAQSVFKIVYSHLEITEEPPCSTILNNYRKTHFLCDLDILTSDGIQPAHRDILHYRLQTAFPVHIRPDGTIHSQVPMTSAMTECLLEFLYTDQVSAIPFGEPVPVFLDAVSPFLSAQKIHRLKESLIHTWLGLPATFFYGSELLEDLSRLDAQSPDTAKFLITGNTTDGGAGGSYIHPFLLSHTSAMFQKVVSGNWQESQNRHISCQLFTSTDILLLKTFLSPLTRQNLILTEHQGVTLLALCEFAEFSPLLKNTLLNFLCDTFLNERAIGFLIHIETMMEPIAEVLKQELIRFIACNPELFYLNTTVYKSLNLITQQQIKEMRNAYKEARKIIEGRGNTVLGKRHFSTS